MTESPAPLSSPSHHRWQHSGQAVPNHGTLAYLILQAERIGEMTGAGFSDLSWSRSQTPKWEVASLHQEEGNVLISKDLETQKQSEWTVLTVSPRNALSSCSFLSNHIFSMTLHQA